MGYALPAYSYALSNPVNNYDPNGKIVVFRSPSPRLLAAINKMKRGKCGRGIWNLLENSETVFQVYEDSAIFGPLGRAEGGTGDLLPDDNHVRGSGRNIEVDVRFDFGKLDRDNAGVGRVLDAVKTGMLNPDSLGPDDVIHSDAWLVGHEFGHGLDFLGGLPPIPGTENGADYWGDCSCE